MLTSLIIGAVLGFILGRWDVKPKELDRSKLGRQLALTRWARSIKKRKNETAPFQS